MQRNETEDFIFISNKIAVKLTLFCTNKLLKNVFEDYEKIFPNRIKEKESSLWIIDKYLNYKTINIENKISVILSFVACGGLVEYNRVKYCDTSNLLCKFKQDGIDDLIIDKAIDAWYSYNLIKDKVTFDFIK